MSESIRFYGPILLIAIIFITISILLMKKFKKKSIYMYLPTIVLWLVSVFLFTFAIFFAEPMQDLGYIVMAMITGLATFITLIVTIVIDIYRKRRKS